MIINYDIKKSFFDILSPLFFWKRGITQLLNVPKIIMANKCILTDMIYKEKTTFVVIFKVASPNGFEPLTARLEGFLWCF